MNAPVTGYAAGIRLPRRSLLAAALTAGAMRARAAPPIRVGVLNDMAGPFADLSGKGSVIAAEMAVADYRAAGGSLAVEVLAGDHQNKPDVAGAIVRRWVDVDSVAAVVDVPNSAVALAVNQILRDKDRSFLASSTATSDLTGKFCAPTTVQYVFDTWSLANSTARTLLERGGDSWFFLTVDYAFGHALERDAAAIVTRLGGKVLGDARHPLNTADFSSYLIAAQASGAKVVALANAGADTVNAIKQAAEFGLTRVGATGSGQRLAGLLVFLTDIHALGLAAAQGLLLTEAFYWDLNDSTRAWSRRFAAQHGGRMPTMNHAGVYSALRAWLAAAEAAGSLSGSRIIAGMRAAPIADPLFGTVTIRTDGRAVHDMYLFQVKSPAESKGPWDYYTLIERIPAAQAFRPLTEGGCSLVAG